jgi:hypothetical protein
MSAEKQKQTFFVLGHWATCIVYQTLRVKKPYTLARFVSREAVKGEEALELHGDTNTGRASTQEQDTMRCQRLTRCGRRQLGSINESLEKGKRY